MNNENNNDGLNSVSLGMVGNIPNMPIDNMGIDSLNGPTNVVPVAPVAPVPPLDINTPVMDNNINNNGVIGSPVVNMPPTFEASNNTLNNGIIGDNNLSAMPPVSPVAPVPVFNNEPINSFSAPPIFNDIGTIPPISDIPVPNVPIEPINNNGSEKGKIFDKLIFVIIVILILTAIGVGLYIFLEMANRKPTTGVRLKNVQLEIGSSIPANLEDYAVFNGVSSANCSLDTSEIKSTDTLNAKYIFKITCGEKVYNGNVEIVDTEKPSVEVKEVSVGLNALVKVDDFINLCTDKTKCSHEFKDSEAVKNHLTRTGSYKVMIVTKDEAGNVTETEASLKVSAEAVASLYLVCSKEVNGYTQSDRLGIDADSNFIKVVTRNYVFNLNETNYNAFKTENANKSEGEYNGIKGAFVLNDQTKALTISKKVTYEELKTEMGSEIPLSYSELKTFYRGKGFNCMVGNE